MTDNLKRCPFCGGKPEVSSFKDGNGRLLYAINCDMKDCPTNPAWATRAEKDAIAAWNRRTEPAGSADHIGGVNEMVTQSTHTENVSIKAVEIDLSDAEIAEIAKRCEKANLHYTLIDFARAVLLAAKGWE